MVHRNFYYFNNINLLVTYVLIFTVITVPKLVLWVSSVIFLLTNLMLVIFLCDLKAADINTFSGSFWNIPSKWFFFKTRLHFLYHSKYSHSQIMHSNQKVNIILNSGDDITFSLHREVNCWRDIKLWGNRVSSTN